MPPSTSIHDQLRAAREARGEDLASLAARVGMREAILCAIDEGRFDDLPAGIYGRAAIRAYAAGVGRDPAEVLAACEPLLRPIEDPVLGLAYLRGVRRPPAPAAAPAPGPAAAPGSDLDLLKVRRSRSDPGPGANRSLKALGAAGIDAAVVVLSLLALVAATTIFCGLRPSALENCAAGFAVMGIVFAITYFVCVGGVAGATLGEQLVGYAAATAGRLTLGDVRARALRAATIDARMLIDTGARITAWALRPHGRLQSSHSPSEG